MWLIENGDTPRIAFLMVDATDSETAETGLSPTFQLSKNGGAFANATNSISEISNGWYYVDLTATETNTDGPIIFRATAAGADEWRDFGQVVSSVPIDAAVVNAQMVDVLTVDTNSLPGQEAPTATPTLREAIMFLYKSWRNKKDNDGSTTNLYADNGTTIDQKQTTSESSGTVTKGEWVSGP